MSEEPIHFTPISEALVRFREGSFLVVMDDEDRENEGDLILAARFASPEQIAFALRYTSGILCAPLTSSLACRLELHPMTLNSTDPHRTAFTVSIDHVDSTTGVSGLDRSRSFKALAEPNVKAEDFRKPGHIFPLVAKDGGVRQRRGHTEASLDLCRLSEVGEEVGLLAELMNEDGTMKRLKECSEFAKEHNLPLITIEQLVKFREEKEGPLETKKKTTEVNDLKLEASCILPIQRKDKFLGKWELRTYSSGGIQHVALIKNPEETLKGKASTLVRVHSECFTGNTLGSLRCDCDDQLDSALIKINEEGRGIAIYVGGHEGRGIGLVNKIRAYSVQDEAKLDTFAANESLGLPRDGRSYEIACAILEDLEIENVNLLTNNKYKVEYLREQGFQVRVTSLPGRKTEFNQDYLAIKKIEQESKETSGAHSHSHSHAHSHSEEEEAEKKEKPGHVKEIPIALPIPSNLNKIRIGVIKTAWNSGLVDSLVNQTKDQLLSAGISSSNIFEVVVPGCYEVPWAAQQLIQTAQNSLDAVLCFGVLIKGETMHFEYISSSVSSAIMNLQMSTGVPILYGILNCLTLEQAAARCGSESQLPLSLSSTAIHMAALRRGFLPLASSLDNKTTITSSLEDVQGSNLARLLRNKSPGVPLHSGFPSILTPQPCDFN